MLTSCGTLYPNRRRSGSAPAFDSRGALRCSSGRQKISTGSVRPRTATCESADGATWLQVTKTSGASDRRPVVTEPAGPDWGYHDYDINLALGNLIADTAAAEKTWSQTSHA